MNWNNVSLVVLGLAAFFGAFFVALWASLVIWTFRDMRARTRDAFAQFLASLMVLVLGPFGIILYFILRPRETLAEKYERSLEEEALLQDIEERQICPGCKQPIQPDYVLCPICHTHLRTPCIHCGRLVHPRWDLCPYCAQEQKPIPGLDQAANVTLKDLEREPGPSTRLTGETGIQSTELPTDMMAELQREADASMAGTEQERADDQEESPKTTRRLRLPLGNTQDDGQAADREPAQRPEGPPAEPADGQTSQGEGNGARQPLSLFRRR